MDPTLLLTRPEAQSRRFLAAVTGRLGRAPAAVISPLLAPELLTPPLPEPPRTLIFTSETGVEAFARLTVARDAPAVCVGERTAAAARAAGFEATSVAGDAETLFAYLSARPGLAPLLHARGREARGQLAARLSAQGIAAAELVVYAQQPRPLTPEALSALAGPAAVIAPLFSPRSAALFAAGAAGCAAPVHAVAMSPAVAAALAPLQVASIVIARRPDADAMLSAVLDRFAAARTA